VIYRNQEQRCRHGFCRTGPRGVSCPTCNGEVPSAANERTRTLLRIGRAYASCELKSQDGHMLTVACFSCKADRRITKSTILRAHRSGLQWRCLECRKHFRRDQVTSARNRGTVPQSYLHDGGHALTGNGNARAKY
jgi:hypothetical protein